MPGAEWSVELLITLLLPILVWLAVILALIKIVRKKVEEGLQSDQRRAARLLRGARDQQEETAPLGDEPPPPDRP